jgi:hypothetical protein
MRATLLVHLAQYYRQSESSETGTELHNDVYAWAWSVTVDCPGDTCSMHRNYGKCTQTFSSEVKR